MVVPARMKRTYVLVHNSKLDSLIKTLHQGRLMQITDTRSAEIDFVKKLDFFIPHYDVLKAEKAYLKIEKIIEILRSQQKVHTPTLKGRNKHHRRSWNSSGQRKLA